MEAGRHAPRKGRDGLPATPLSRGGGGVRVRRDVVQKARPGWREFRRNRGGKEAESSFPGDGLPGGRLVTSRGGPGCGGSGGGGRGGLWAGAHAGRFPPAL